MIYYIWEIWSRHITDFIKQIIFQNLHHVFVLHFAKKHVHGLNGDPVSVRANEHLIIENAYEKGYAKAKAPAVRTGKTVAVVGSGPSGLAVADQLNKEVIVLLFLKEMTESEVF